MAPATTRLMPPHWKGEMRSSRKVMARRATKMGLVWAMATAREASIRRRPRKRSTTEQPIRMPEATGAAAVVQGRPAGTPRMARRMLP